MRKIAPPCPHVYNQFDPSRKKTIVDKWEFYQDPKGDWRWRRIAPNGRIVGNSGEGYRNRADCVANARRNGYTGS